MKRIQMPSSYAVVPDGEKALLGEQGFRRPSDLQERYERSACRRKVSARLIFPEIKNALRRWILTMPQGILFVFYMTRTAPCSRSESR